MFNAAYGADQTKTGHGIYAEEAGAILDKLAGEQSTVVGRDNAKNGPDKIVDSSPIQCKYCKQAYNSVDACFKKNPQTGTKSFRYYDLNGNAMKVEVPADQYAQAIEYMKTRISDGQVPGVTDPNAAYDIIRKGKLTYNQALNLAKAGTIESITFDAYTGAVNCLSVFGISAVVSFAQTYWVTKDYKKAAKSAIFTGVQVYGMAFAGGIIASQLSRTGLASALNPLATEISKSISPQMAQEIINAFNMLTSEEQDAVIKALDDDEKQLRTAIPCSRHHCTTVSPLFRQASTRRLHSASRCCRLTFCKLSICSMPLPHYLRVLNTI